MSFYPRHKRGEAVGILFLASSLMLLLALFSYAPLDRSLNVSSASELYQNWIGQAGAWSADFFFQYFGLPAFFLPLALLFLGYKKLRSRPLEYPVVQWLGLVSALTMLCAALFLLDPFFTLELNYTPGGVLGMLMGNLLLRFFNTAGALVVVSTVLLLALVMSTRFSLEVVLDWASDRNWNPFEAIRRAWRGWKKRRQDRRQLDQLRRGEKPVMHEVPPSESAPQSPFPKRKDAPAPSRSRQLDPPPVPEDGSEPVVKKLELGLDQEFMGDSAPPITPPKSQSYQLPPLRFLPLIATEIQVNKQELLDRAEQLQTKYAEFGVHGRVLHIDPGPVVTTFEFKPDPGIKYTRITNLVDDICLALKAASIRIDRIPGKNTIGIEVPNANREIIYLSEILGSTVFQESASLLTLGLGKLINGNTFVADLTRMPHLLIAGATGAGKSVGINCFVCSILYKASPQQVNFIMIDPKRLELGLYADIPHLLTPIVTDPKKASNALNWAVREMERRYKLLAKKSVRNLDQYNRLVENCTPEEREEEQLEPLPLIVVIVDELADLMLTVGKDVEASLTRLAQMARAIGIHLILATQRPSVDVITGLIKANFPSRLSFRVSSKIDSRTVLDRNGAEQLLGRGDMLFLSSRTLRPLRIHGGFVSEKEIQRITDFLRRQALPDYQEEILESAEEPAESGVIDVQDLQDPLYADAAQFVAETGRASTSLLQRRLRIGYGRAARILDMMEGEGLVGPSEGSKGREVLVPPNFFDEVNSQD